MTDHQNGNNSRSFSDAIEELISWVEASDKILIGAGAGLSAAAGLSYLDEDLFRQFQPEMAAMGYHYPYELFQHENDGWPQAREWAYLIRHVNFVRHVFPAAELYKKLLKIVEGRDYFAVTSNADRQLMRAGFSMDRVFEAQGNYDRLRCTARCTRETWEIKPYIDKLLPLIDPDTFMISDESAIPYCPYCGAPLYTAFRAFEGYKLEEARYVDWLAGTNGKRLCILELGVGFNTPAVIRWPFERLTFAHDCAHLFRVNRGYREWSGHGGHPVIPEPIMDKSTAVPYDAKDVIERLYDRLKGGAPA
ncbi:MAG: hypothetical protein GXY05_02260 [Clostridiales bacterium]|nr:hypothetical protein [Clostridiales bacterium]